MKNYYYLLFIILHLFLICCDKKVYNGVEMSDSLKKTLIDYIAKYDADSIIRVGFSKAVDHVDMLVYHEPFYEKDLMDGCFELNGKLIYYHSDFEGLADSLVTPYYHIDKECLSHYSSWVLSEYDAGRDIHEYCILSKDRIIENAVNKHLYKPDNDNNEGVLSSPLNHIINEQLNSNGCLVTSLFFAVINNEVCFCINSGSFYDSKNIDGCIIKNGRLITFHSVDNTCYNSLVDANILQRNLSLIEKYKKLSDDDRLVYWTFARCYRIESQDSIIEQQGNADLIPFVCK